MDGFKQRALLAVAKIPNVGRAAPAAVGGSQGERAVALYVVYGKAGFRIGALGEVQHHAGCVLDVADRVVGGKNYPIRTEVELRRGGGQRTRLSIAKIPSVGIGVEAFVGEFYAQGFANGVYVDGKIDFCFGRDRRFKIKLDDAQVAVVGGVGGGNYPRCGGKGSAGARGANGLVNGSFLRKAGRAAVHVFGAGAPKKGGVLKASCVLGQNQKVKIASVGGVAKGISGDRQSGRGSSLAAGIDCAAPTADENIQAIVYLKRRGHNIDLVARAKSGGHQVAPEVWRQFVDELAARTGVPRGIHYRPSAPGLPKNINTSKLVDVQTKGLIVGRSTQIRTRFQNTVSGIPGNVAVQSTQKIPLHNARCSG